MNVGNFEEEEIIEEFQPVASIVLSDDTKIRGVSWGDFKEEAMILDFEPSNFFVRDLKLCLLKFLVPITKRRERIT